MYHNEIYLQSILVNETAYTDQMEKTRFVFKFVQAARSRKSKKKQTSLLSSMTSDTMSMDSSSTVSFRIYHLIHPLSFIVFLNFSLQKHILFSTQSTEYRDSSITKVENLTDVDGLQSSLSADDSADLFCEDSGMYTKFTKLVHIDVQLNDWIFSFHRVNVIGDFNTSPGRQILCHAQRIIRLRIRSMY